MRRSGRAPGAIIEAQTREFEAQGNKIARLPTMRRRTESRFGRLTPDMDGPAPKPRAVSPVGDK